jgi:hypothetical protein
MIMLPDLYTFEVKLSGMATEVLPSPEKNNIYLLK